MEPECFYFVFHHRPSLRDIFAGRASALQYFGHVEAMGYTVDDTWFFFDPGRYRTTLSITHIHAEVEAMMAEKYALAHTVIKIEARGKFSFPAHPPMNCVSQCAAFIGIRAFTIPGFRKRLLLEKGVIIHGPDRRC